MIIENIENLKKRVAYYTAKYPKTAMSLEELKSSLQRCIDWGAPEYDDDPDYDPDDDREWVCYPVSDECLHRCYYFSIIREPEVLVRFDGMTNLD